MRIVLFLRLIIPASAILVLFTVVMPQNLEAQMQSTQVQVFRDNFDGTVLDPDVWQVYANGGTVRLV